MASELKPCPFCGKEPKRQENRAGGIVVFCNSLECELLSIDGEAEDADENDAVIAAWNTRPEDARLSAHTAAAKLALDVLEDELGVRMESFCAKREDGTYDRSVCDQQELADLESCEAAIKALTDAMGGK